jgi:hypothetical protein
MAKNVYFSGLSPDTLGDAWLNSRRENCGYLSGRTQAGRCLNSFREK